MTTIEDTLLHYIIISSNTLFTNLFWVYVSSYFNEFNDSARRFLNVFLGTGKKLKVKCSYIIGLIFLIVRQG